MPKYSIIITSKECVDITWACIESVKKYSNDYEIILVDNGSSKETQEKYRALEYGNFILKTYNEPMGWSKAANIGMRRAEGDYIVVLNNDTVVAEGWLDIMADCCNKHNAVIGLAGQNMIITEDNIQLTDYFGNVINREWILPCKFPVVTDYVGGGCMMLKRKMLDDIGYLDEDIRFAQDVLYGIRTKAKGYKSMVVCVPGYCHYVSESYKSEMGLEKLHQMTADCLKQIAAKLKEKKDEKELGR